MGEDIAVENIRLSRSEIVVATDEAYWQLLRVGEQVSAAEKYRQVVKELLQNLRDAQVVGMATPNEVLKAQVRYNEAGLSEKPNSLLIAYYHPKQSEQTSKTERKKQIKFQPVLLKFYLKRPSHFRPLSISPFIVAFSKVSINLQERSEITISPKKNGY